MWLCAWTPHSGSTMQCQPLCARAALVTVHRRPDGTGPAASQRGSDADKSWGEAGMLTFPPAVIMIHSCHGDPTLHRRPLYRRSTVAVPINPTTDPDVPKIVLHVGRPEHCHAPRPSNSTAAPPRIHHPTGHEEAPQKSLFINARSDIPSCLRCKSNKQTTTLTCQPEQTRSAAFIK
jgi:hypothetical protein